MNPLQVLRESWYFFSHNVARIATLCLPLLLLEAVCQQLFSEQLGDMTTISLALLFGLVIYPLYTAALILFLACRTQQQSLSNKALFSKALRLWPSFALLAALSTLLIILGLSLLIVPGLLVMLHLVFAEYLLVLDGLTPLAAIKESFRLTRGYFWPIAACLLSLMLPLWLLEGMSGQLLGEQPDALARVLLDSLNGFLQLFATVLGFRLFMLRKAISAGRESVL